MFWFDFHWQIQTILNSIWYPLNGLLLIVAGVIAYLGYRKPVWAVAMTIVLLPTYLFRSSIYFLPFTFLEVCIIATFSGWVLAAIVQKKLRRTEPPYTYRWPIILLLIGATIGLFVSPIFTSAAGLWKAYFIEPILFLIVLKEVIKNDTNRRTVLWALGIASLGVSLLAIYQKFTGFAIAEPAWVNESFRRVTAFFTSPNAVGLYLGPIIALYAGWLVAEWRNTQATVLKLIILVLALLAVVFTVSQGTWLGLLAAAVVLSYFGWDKKKTVLITLIIIIALVASPLRPRILPIVTFQDHAGQNRITLLKTSWQYLTANPSQFLLGAGILGFSGLHQQTRDPLLTEPLLYPHNIIFNFWTEAGLVGLLGMLWLLIKFFGQTIRRLPNSTSRFLTIGVLAAMVVIVVHGLVDVPYFKNDLAVLFWIVVGLSR